MGCGSARVKVGALDRHLAVKKARMNNIFDAIEEPGVRGDMRRLALGLVTGESTDNARALSKATEYYIYNIIGRTPPKQKFVLDDIEIGMIETSLAKATADADRAIKKGTKLIEKYGSVEAVARNKDAMKSLTKFWSARGPVTMLLSHSRHLPGGEELFNNLVNLETEHSARVKSAGAEIGDLVKTIKEITGELYKTGRDDMEAVDTKLRELGNQRILNEEAFRAGDVKSQKRLNEIDAEIKRYNKDRVAMLAREGNTNRTALVNRAVIDVAEAKTDVDAKLIAEKYMKDHKLNYNALIGTRSDTRKLLDRHIEVGKQTVRYLRRLIDVELDRIGATDIEKSEAESMIRDMGVIEDGYFPQQEVFSARPIETVSMLKNMIDALQSSGTTDPKKALAVIGQISKHMEKRTGNLEMNNRDYNVAAVLRHYTESMLHTNYVVKTQNAFGQYLGAIHKSGVQNGSAEMLAFTIQADKFLDFSRRRMVGTQSHGFGHELSNMALITTVMQKLGIFRPASVVRNVIEGESMIASKIGMHNMARIDTLISEDSKGLGAELDLLVTKHKISLGGNDRWGSETLGTLLSPKIRALINDPELVETYLSVERARQETIAYNLQKFNRGLAKASNASMNAPLVGWSKWENRLRQQAFKYGAVMAMEQAMNVYGDLFKSSEPIPKALIEKFDLDRSVLDGSPEHAEARDRERAKVREAEGVRGGLSLLYRSQGMYSALARHPIEDFDMFGLHIGKMGHLFRQYPESWNTQIVMGVKDVFYGAKTNGIYRGLIAQPKMKNTEGKNPWNREMPPIYAMASMLAMVGLGGYLQEKEKDGLFGLGFRIVGMYRGDAPTVWGFLRGITSDDPHERKWANYGKSGQSIFTGPIGGDAEWWMNYTIMANAARKGHLPLGVHTAAQVLGYNPDPAVLRVTKTPESWGDTAKGGLWHWVNGFSTVSDMVYLRNEYNKDAPDKGGRMLLAALKRFTGAESVTKYKQSDNKDMSIRP